MVVVGGTGTISGPVLGAGLVRLLPIFASSYTDRWQMLLGLVLIFVVLFARGGILGLWKRLRSRQPS
jgi:branched-chain amino acid transport system permease protein